MSGENPISPLGVAPSPTATGEDLWHSLRRHTAARIALGRSGASLSTSAALDFDLAHAQARDAVLTPLDVAQLRRDLEIDGWSVLEVHSRASERSAYLARPDWGRRLDAASAALLAAARKEIYDIAFVVSDGLSSTAVQSHAAPLLRALRALLGTRRIAPTVIATQARVALADEVGALLEADIVISLIGERPGLSSPDSLGIYVTYAPRVGRNDSERNCISNVRPQGLPYEAAVLQLAALVDAMGVAKISGVQLRFDLGRELGGTRS